MPKARNKKMTCPECGGEMNHHAEKLDLTALAAEPQAADRDLNGILEEVHTCPQCATVATRRASS